MLRKILVAIAIVLLAGAAALWWYTRPLPVLTVSTWAGPYGRAQAAAQTRPYGVEKRVNVRLDLWDGEIADVAKAVSTGAYKGDVIDFELPTAIAACRKGLLERIDPVLLPPGADGTPAAQDFVPGAIGPCWVASVVYSQVVIFAADRFKEAPPTAMAGLFDPAKFPGRRALVRTSPKFNLEMALLAEGVAPGNVYRTLETPEGLARAFAKLDTIRDAVIWTGSAKENLELVRSGQAAFATALNGDVQDAVLKGFRPGVIWDRQMYEMDVFGIPKGTQKKEMALDFLRASTTSERLADMASWVPYGPARRSAQALVGDNPDLKIPMRDILPTAHFDTAFLVDDGWWLTHQAEMTTHWQAWLSRPAPLPVKGKHH
jgi:putative spermidine/putrescine transport system substrate-binding protein